MRNKKVLRLKRYNNRKLYCPEEKRFYNFTQIQEAVLEGKRISIVDNASGRDITLEILAKIFAHGAMELEFKKSIYGQIYNLFINAFIMLFKRGRRVLRRGKARIRLLKRKTRQRKGKSKKGGEYGYISEV